MMVLTHFFYLSNTIEFACSAFSGTSAPAQITILNRSAVKEGENDAAIDMKTTIHGETLHKLALHRVMVMYV